MSAARALGTARAVDHMLHQASVWTDAQGITHRLEDMEPSHRRHVIAFLRRRADILATYAGLGLCLGWPWPESHGDAADDIAAALDAAWRQMDSDPVAWLLDTPLLQRLMELEGIGSAPPPLADVAEFLEVTS